MSASPRACQTGQHAHTPHGEAQRRALVYAAYRLIAERGFEHLRTRDVAGRAGVNIATLHYYFKTKEDLIRGVVDYLVQHFATAHSATPQGAPQTPLDELREEFADADYQARATPEPYIVLFELFLRSLRDAAVRDILRGMNAHWQRHITRYLTDGARQGQFRADLDIAAAAPALIALIKGSVLQVMLAPETFPVEGIHREIERWLTGHTRAAES